MVNTPLPTALFEPTRGLSVPDPSLHPGENAVGVNNKVALQVAAPSCVNSVNSLLTVPRSTFAFIGVYSQQKIGLPRIFRAFNDSCPSASAPSLHQPLLPPYKVSPIRVAKLRQEVLTHPDQSFVNYVLDGLQNGFRVGFNPASVSLKSATQNMPSASLQPSVIDDYLHTELAKGRVAGPFSSPPLLHLHISRFGVIPKKHQPGKWRLILDLSSPDGHSVNDGIRKDPFTVQYMKVDDIIDGIMSLGRGTLLEKFDVESAYHIPIHPNDRYLLGMQWQGNYFVDMALPFGLRSAPYIFSSVADLVEWVLKTRYDVSFLLHYLDDFHTLGLPNSQTCQPNLDTCIQQFQDWGIPLQPDKLEGPSTLLTVLGIELDSLLLQARLPQEKFDRIHTLLVTWSLKRHCTRKELEPLISKLQHACKVVPSGRTFLCRMINLLSAFRRDDHPIRLNSEFRLDLSWWLEFFQSWNGYSFLLSPRWAPIPDLHVSSDAAGSVGYGAILGRDWFVGKWSPLQLPLSIAYKELFPIVLAASLWGHQWSAKRVEFCSDNTAVVEVLRSGTSRDSNLMVLLRHLSLLAARHSFVFTARHIPGKSNAIADAISRFEFQRFHQLAPYASPTATSVPPWVLDQLPVV